MTDKELYRQKKQAQLEMWKADIAKLKARTSLLSAEIQIEAHKQIKALETRMDDSNSKLAELAEAGEEAYKSLKSNIETMWDSLKNGLNDITAKFKHS